MLMCYRFFFFNDTATTEIYTLSLHDALPISIPSRKIVSPQNTEHGCYYPSITDDGQVAPIPRSEEHTSELQSPCNLVCRLLLEKKKEDMSPHLIVVLDSRPQSRLSSHLLFLL